MGSPGRPKSKLPVDTQSDRSSRINTDYELDIFNDRHPLWGCGLAHMRQDINNVIALQYLKSKHNVYIAPIENRITCLECPFPDCLLSEKRKMDVVYLSHFERELARWL